MPYDDFQGAFINQKKWKQGEFVREVDVTNHRLLSKLGTPNPITIGTYPYKNTNDLVFFDPELIRSVRADVSILQKIVTNNAAVKAIIGGRWYHFYVSGQGGYVWGEIAIKEMQPGSATWCPEIKIRTYSVWDPRNWKFTDNYKHWCNLHFIHGL
jgi:hypothetical protein